MKQTRIKHNETGRSMVEMLGVLAIVGVLSIGGVAGYRYAVDKMNANEIINELKKRAITASQQRVLGQDINLAEYGVGAKIKGTYTVTPTKNYDGNASQFALKVAGVPERVCDMILESDWVLPTEKVVANGSCVEGANGNTMTFAFNNTLESGDVGNGGNGEGDEGNNDPTDTPIQQCGENEYRLADGTCKEDTKCTDPNQFWNSWTNQCELCPTESNSVLISSSFEDTCLKCSNAVPNKVESAYFYCVNCPDNRVVCGQTCCESNQGCQVSGTQYSHIYTCVPKVCTNDNNCVGKITGDGAQGKAVCDTFSGQCVWGCKDNNDCLSGQFCNLNEESTGYGSNAPRYGVCESATLFNNGVGISVGDTTVYRSLKSNLTWWDAQNFCKANNMNLFNLRPHCVNEWNDTESWTCSSLDVTDNSNWFGWTGMNFNYERSFRVNLSDGDVFALYLTTDSPQDAETAALCE